MQSEANSYSTAIENHDFMPWLTCCMKLKCIVGQTFLQLPGSAFAFLVVLHLPAALELDLDWIWRPGAVRINWQACRKPHWVNMWP